VLRLRLPYRCLGQFGSRLAPTTSFDLTNDPCAYREICPNLNPPKKIEAATSHNHEKWHVKRKVRISLSRSASDTKISLILPFLPYTYILSSAIVRPAQRVESIEKVQEENMDVNDRFSDKALQGSVRETRPVTSPRGGDHATWTTSDHQSSPTAAG
jgi:hypothetical protein